MFNDCPQFRDLAAHVSGGINRIIVEKPSGKDLESARELLGSLKQYWSEDETFRIDRYLGNEMAKNMLVLRFANVDTTSWTTLGRSSHPSCIG
ncbi:hypothetical protein HGRIS_014874 [Hohenbuehelia grisea]|uniref:glucose-6-phosphate dehydrogenase (NADP(+)) n=1 Tax=Hohenbuehelia grisea TaxID=104357 RepID=A0ABR3IR18_9AGAR